MSTLLYLLGLGMIAGLLLGGSPLLLGLAAALLLGAGALLDDLETP